MSDDASSHSDDVPSLTDEQKKRQKHPENFDPKNKLKLGQFHRYGINKPQAKSQVRPMNNKKRIRNLERMLAKSEATMPEELKIAKQKELKDLRKSEKSKKEAELFETRYKKIRFFEKKKIIRKLENLEKQKKEEGANIDVEKAEYKKYLTYVNNFPVNQKYLSLFPNKESEESKETREKMMEKIIKTAEVKVRLREKELFAMDKELEADIFGTTVAENEARLNKKVREIE